MTDLEQALTDLLKATLEALRALSKEIQESLRVVNAKPKPRRRKRQA